MPPGKRPRLRAGLCTILTLSLTTVVAPAVGPIAAFGATDACKASAVAAESDTVPGCPGSSEPVREAPWDVIGEGGTVPPPIPVAPDTQVPTAVPPPTAGPGQVPPATARKRPHAFFKERPRKVVRTRGRRAKVIFRFGASEVGVHFLCRVDHGPWRRCPARFVRRFGLGRHVLRVKARDRAGIDSVPAVHRFRVRYVPGSRGRLPGARSNDRPAGGRGGQRRWRGPAGR